MACSIMAMQRTVNPWGDPMVVRIHSCQFLSIINIIWVGGRVVKGGRL